MNRFTQSGQFIYAGPFKTREKAAASLEDCFAAGEVSTCENPRVETLRDHRGRVTGYAVSVRA